MELTLPYILQRITNVLLLNSSFIKNPGLLNGKMGICIFFYHLARKTGESIYEEYAGELLDEIFVEISLTTPIDFENGLTGIGWGIEYLVQQGFVEGDTNEVLESIDCSVLGGLLARPFTIMDDKELYGIGLYYLARLKGKDNKDNNLSLLRIKTHMIYLLEDCKRLLIMKELFEQNVTILSIRQLCSVAYFLIETHKINLCPKISKKLLMNLYEYAKNKLPLSVNRIDSITLFYLIKQSLSSTFSFNDMYHNEMPRFTPIMESEQTLYEFIDCANYSLIYCMEFEQHYEFPILVNKALSYILNEINWQNLIKVIDYETLSLRKGLAGIGLSILNVSFTNHYYEQVLKT